MTDRITAEQRSRNMARIKSRDTQPEIRLRSALHRAGLRFRVCRTDLPGRPDIIFPRHKLAVQIRGCFWHFHQNCPSGRIPQSSQHYWRPKLEKTVMRDTEKDQALRNLGWRLVIFWECEIRTASSLGSAVNAIKKIIDEDEN